MSYYHELYVVCDECHTSLLVDEATYEDADNDAADEGWQVVVGIEDKHYCCLLYTSPSPRDRG